MKLATEMQAIDWQKHVAEAMADVASIERMTSSSLRLAIWAKQLEIVHANNPALPFIREMQASAQQAIVLNTLALYKPSASSLRSMLEAALYFTYYRDHPKELSTLIRDKRYFIKKQDIFDYHKQHTAGFVAKQASIQLVGRAEKWYSSISALIHGQIPGQWLNHKSIGTICVEAKTFGLVVTEFETSATLINDLFLCTLAEEIWDDVSVDAKRHVLKGVAGEVKNVLRLDGV